MENLFRFIRIYVDNFFKRKGQKKNKPKKKEKKICFIILRKFKSLQKTISNNSKFIKRRAKKKGKTKLFIMLICWFQHYAQN